MLIGGGAGLLIGSTAEACNCGAETDWHGRDAGEMRPRGEGGRGRAEGVKVVYKLTRKLPSAAQR